jgi:1-deoxy-D-xylulose-5-phosphate reductoisomerase
MQKIAILGSTGSIGKNALDVIRNLDKRFCVRALTTNSNIEVLDQQVRRFKPAFVCVNQDKPAAVLQRRLGKKTKVFCGQDGLERIVQDRETQKIVLAISGSAALKPFLGAIEAGKDIALANKEALVIAGPLLMHRAMAKRVKIIPIDSEQSAIWQCLEGQDRKKLKRIYLTASGGPFRKSSQAALESVSIERVLRHPRWKMGKKISVDSANLMNKGLELLEAMYLFGVGPDKIKILIHPEAIIHSMVEFVDGVVLAQLSVTDMRIPIQYALSYPERLPNALEGLDFSQIKSLNFQEPDFKKFPCLELAFEAAYAGGTLPCVLNAANEVCVEEFLKGGLKFLGIPRVIEKVLKAHKKKASPDLTAIRQADTWAREAAKRIIIEKRFN